MFLFDKFQAVFCPCHHNRETKFHFLLCYFLPDHYITRHAVFTDTGQVNKWILPLNYTELGLNELWVVGRTLPGNYYLEFYSKWQFFWLASDIFGIFDSSSPTSSIWFSNKYLVCIHLSRDSTLFGEEGGGSQFCSYHNEWLNIFYLHFESVFLISVTVT